jgi:tetratricopeptide (TPR) repeat protein
MALERLYEKQGNWEEARKICERAHALDSASPLIANDLAYLYLEHGGDVNIALSLAQMAKQSMPASLNITDTLGWAYYKERLWDPAIAALEECVQKDPRNTGYQFHLGMTYLAAGRPDRAGQLLRQVIQDNPNGPQAASAKAALDRISKGSR